MKSPPGNGWKLFIVPFEVHKILNNYSSKILRLRAGTFFLEIPLPQGGAVGRRQQATRRAQARLGSEATAMGPSRLETSRRCTSRLLSSRAYSVQQNGGRQYP